MSFHCERCDLNGEDDERREKTFHSYFVLLEGGERGNAGELDFRFESRNNSRGDVTGEFRGNSAHGGLFLCTE